MQHTFNSSQFEHVRNTIQPTFGNLIHPYNAYTDGMKYFKTPVDVAMICHEIGTANC